LSKTFKSKGVVFRSLKYSETSLILDIYTQMHGLGSYIVSGVRKAKSKTSNVYNPMNIIDLVAYVPGESLSRIKEASYDHTYQKLDREVIRAAIGTYFIDLLRSSIKEKEPNELLYLYIVKTLKDLDSGASLGNLPIRYAIELASHLGFQLSDNYSDQNQYFDLQVGAFIDNDIRHKYILNDAVSYSLHAVMQNPVNAAMDKISRKVLLDALMDYYRLHIEDFRPLRSLPVLRTLLS